MTIHARRRSPAPRIEAQRGKELLGLKLYKIYSERVSLRLYWEFFNLFNRNNFGNNFQENASFELRSAARIFRRE